MSGTPPTPTPSATTISTLTEGKLTSVVGRITEVDDRPASISTQDGKIIQIFHVVFTDKTGSIQATMWDRTADFRNFRLGDVVEIQNVVAKICRENFQEYGPISINFGRASRIGERCSRRRRPFPTYVHPRSTPSEHVSRAFNVLGHPREEACPRRRHLPCGL